MSNLNSDASKIHIIKVCSEDFSPSSELKSIRTKVLTTNNYCTESAINFHRPAILDRVL